MFLFCLLGVCIKPVLVTAYQPNIDEATLVWIFNAINFDHLVMFHCKKDDKPIYSGGRYQILQYPSNTTENKIYIVLKISGAKDSDIGTYSILLNWFTMKH